jgi:hypothetical protein
MYKKIVCVVAGCGLLIGAGYDLHNKGVKENTPPAKQTQITNPYIPKDRSSWMDNTSI